MHQTKDIENKQQKTHTLRRAAVVTVVVILLAFIMSVVVFATSKPQVSLIDGFYCTQNSRGNITIVGIDGLQQSTTLLLPEKLDGKTVDELAGGAFNGSRMKNFIVPSTIKIIGKNAFDGEGVFYIYMVGRKNLEGMQLEENWSGVGEVVFQDVNPQINMPPTIKEVDDFTKTDTDKKESSLQVEGNEEVGSELPDVSSSASTSTDGSNGEDELKEDQSRALSRIDVLNPPAKTAYVEGQLFDPSGMIIKAVYTDGFQQLVTGYSFSRAALSQSDTSVIISYTDNGTFTTRIPITVDRKKPVKLAITVPPTKTDYVELEHFKADGMMVKAQYNNGDTRIVTADFPDVSLALNQQSITVTYIEGNVTVTALQEIKVIQKIPVKLSITKPPVKTAYIESTDFDETGLALEVDYNNGQKAIPRDYTYKKEKLVAGQQTVQLVYRENGAAVTVNQPITVRKRLPVKLEILSPPTKTSYIEQEVFDASGVETKATYDNGEWKIVIATPDTSALAFGQEAVKLSYSENGGTATANQPISVRKKLPTKLTIIKPPTKTAYIEEELFEPDGMVVEATYDNGKTETVTSYSFDKSELTFGKTDVPLSYEENGGTVTTSQSITVSKRLPTKLIISTPPTKTAYIEEELFAPTGMVVKAEYDNGKTHIVTGFIISSSPLTPGQTAVIISYGENGDTVTAKQEISVRKKLPTRLVITSPPSNTNYIEGELFNPLGLMTKVVYDNSKEKQVTAAYTNTELTAGQTGIELSYTENGKTVTVNQPISVAAKKPARLIIKQPPDKTDYSEGLKFKSAGMLVEAEYDNGKRINVVGYTFPDVRLRQGQTTVTISYTENGKTVAANAAVTVGPQLATYEKWSCSLTTCSPCSGSGKINSIVTCTRCGGDGSVSSSHSCGSCGGSGSKTEVVCYTSCGGSCKHGANCCGSCVNTGSNCGTSITHTERRSCSSCGGDGTVSGSSTCGSCSGSGHTGSIVTCTTCAGSGKSGYKKDNLIGTVTGVASVLPLNGHHSDGYWYVRKSLIQD